MVSVVCLVYGRIFEIKVFEYFFLLFFWNIFLKFIEAEVDLIHCYFSFISTYCICLLGEM